MRPLAEGRVHLIFVNRVLQRHCNVLLNELVRAAPAVEGEGPPEAPGEAPPHDEGGRPLGLGRGREVAA